jgi:hypothetical protein
MKLESLSFRDRFDILLEKRPSGISGLRYTMLYGKSQLDLVRLLMSHREVTHREISDYFFRRRVLSCLSTKMQFYAS